MADTTGAKSLEEMSQDLNSRTTKLDEIEKKIDETKKLLEAELEKMKAHPDIQSSFSLARRIYGVKYDDVKLTPVDASAWMSFLNGGWPTSSEINRLSENAYKQGEELLFQAAMANKTYLDLSQKFTELKQDATELRALVGLESENRARLVAMEPLASLYQDLHEYYEKLKDKVKGIISEMPTQTKYNLETKIENMNTVKIKGTLYDCGGLDHESLNAKNYHGWKPNESDDQLVRKFVHLCKLHTILTSSKSFSEKIHQIENVMKEKHFEKEFSQQRGNSNKLFSSQSDSIPLLEKLKTTMSDIKQKLGLDKEPELKEKDKREPSSPRSSR